MLGPAVGWPLLVVAMTICTWAPLSGNHVAAAPKNVCGSGPAKSVSRRGHDSSVVAAKLVVHLSQQVAAQHVDPDETDDGERNYNQDEDRGDQLDAQRSALRQFPDGPPEAGVIACSRHLKLNA